MIHVCMLSSPDGRRAGSRRSRNAKESHARCYPPCPEEPRSRLRGALMRAIATWCVRRRRIVVAAWIVALIALTVIAQGVGSSYKDSFSLSGTQSFDALHLLQKVAPKASGDREQIVFAVDR